MKFCPYCTEEIQESAIKCRYCGEWLNTSRPSDVLRPEPTVNVPDDATPPMVETALLVESEPIELAKPDSVSSKPRGVGGWLLLFIVVQWLPLFGLLGRVGDFDQLFGSSMIMFTGWAVLGIIAGMALLYTGHSAPVMYVKIFLWVDILLGVTFAVSYASVPSMSGQLVGAALRSVLWLLYFHKSKRVRATYYGAEPSPSSTQEIVKPKTPSQFHATQQGSLKRPAVVVLVVLLVVAAIGTVVLKRTSMHKPQEGSAGDIRERAQSLGSAIDANANRFDEALNDLKGLGVFSISRNAEAEHVIGAIEKVQVLELQSEKQAREFHDFVAGNKDELRARGLDQLLDVDGIYGATYKTYHTDLTLFLKSYREMAAYVRDHALAIQRSGTRENKRYDVLYAAYVDTMKRQNQAYYDHVSFLRTYASQHPGISRILKDLIPEQKE